MDTTNTNVSDMFETALRLKIRFNFHGTIGAEDLWDLTAKNLDTIYRDLVIEAKGTEDTLLDRKTNAELELKIALVKHVFSVKKNEFEENKAKAEKITQKRRLQEVLVRKQDQKLETLSPEEIQKMIDEL
jgi:hypothetical protein